MFRVRKDKDGWYFVNRPGVYFEPILEYMITGELLVPRSMDKKALVREARFYCIEIPLDERHESLSFITGFFLWFLIVQMSGCMIGR